MVKSFAFTICILAAAIPLLPSTTPSVPLEVHIDIKPRTARGIIPVRTLPYHATAAISEAESRAVIGTVDLDLEPGKGQQRTESVAPYKITFQAKVAADGLRAAGVVTVWKGEELVTRQTSDVSLER